MTSRPISRPDLHQLITYINEGRESFDNEPHFIIRHNTLGNNPREVAEDFKQNNLLIPQGKMKRIGVQHIILSWSPKEKHLLDDTKLFAFAEKFSELMDFDRAISFGRVHYEKENIHCHFAVSASYLGSGKSRRISKSKLKEIQIEMNRFQEREFPELKHSLLYLPELKKSRESSLGIPLPKKMREVDGSVRSKIRGKKSQLEIVRNQLLEIAKKHYSKQNFIRAVNNEKTISVYHRNNLPAGIITETGKKFRFKRLALDIDNLQREVRLNELNIQQNKNRDSEREQSLER